jgi:phage terminase large subunit
MRLWSVPVRITRAKRCREGFYVIVNGQRVRLATKALALEWVDSLLSMQRIQVMTVREYVEAHRQKISKQQPQTPTPPNQKENRP